MGRMTDNPKSSGSSTSSGESGDSGSALNEPMLLRRSHSFPGDKKIVQRQETTTAVDGSSYRKVFVASTTVNSTRTRSRSTTRTSERPTNQQTLEGSTLRPYQGLTYYARAFLASPSAWRGRDGGSRTRGAHFSLKSLGSLKSPDLAFYSLRMSRDSFRMTKDGRSTASSLSWMRWGMTANGKCLTANTSESRRTEKGSSLSGILEANPGERYFLSDKALGSLLAHDKKHKEAGNGFGASILITGKGEQDR